MRLKPYKASCHKGRMRYQGLGSPLGQIPATCFPSTKVAKHAKESASTLKHTAGMMLSGGSRLSKSARPDYRIYVLASARPSSAGGAWSARITGPGVDKVISSKIAAISSFRQLEIHAVTASLQHILWPGRVIVVSLDDSFGKSRKPLDVLVPADTYEECMNILADAPLWGGLTMALRNRSLSTRGATAQEQKTVFRELSWKAENESGAFLYKRWAIE